MARWLPLALMFVSGASALGYELVWMRMLTRAFGVTVHAVSTLVAVYMGGLALGAAAASRYRWRGGGLGVYARLELGAGAAALAATWAMRRLPEVVAALGGGEPLAPAWRAVLAAAVLLPPTVLLGATLPALVSHWEGRGEPARGPGLLYGANTVGAAVGVAAAGFWTIGEWGETATVAWAATMNLLAAGAAFAWSGRQSSRAGEIVPTEQRGRGADAVLWLFGLSGFCSLGYEILWTRQLIPLLGNSTYAFSLLLAVYLLAMGLGSYAAARSGLIQGARLETFSLLQFSLALLGLMSLAAYRIIGLGLDSPAYLYSPLQARGDFLVLLSEALVLVGPPSLAMGCLFPVAAKLCAGSSGAAGATARLYAANTLGGIAGSLVIGFWGIERLGVHASWLGLSGLNVAAGIAALALDKGRRRGSGGLAALAALIGLLGVFVRRDPGLEIISRRVGRMRPEGHTVLFHDESAAATVTGFAHAAGKTLFINGIDTSGTGVAGKLMAVLPNLFLESPRSTLVICLGVGATLRAALQLGGEVHAVELIGAVARRLPHFQPDLPAGAGLFIEDGRNHLLRSRERYDTVIVDAAPPLYSAGAVNLYTREFLELARAHLTPQGIFALWLPAFSFEEDYWRILRGMSDVFPHVTVWGVPGALPGVLYFGSRESLARAPGLLDQRIRRRLKAPELRGLTEANIRSSFLLSDAEVRAFVGRYEGVTDDRPLTEFPLRRFMRKEKLERALDFWGKARAPRSGEAAAAAN